MAYSACAIKSVRHFNFSMENSRAVCTKAAEKGRQLRDVPSYSWEKQSEGPAYKFIPPTLE